MKEPNSPEKKPDKPRRAKGQTQTSISISEAILIRARQAAEKERRSFSQWIEILLELHFERIDRETEADLKLQKKAVIPLPLPDSKVAEDEGQHNQTREQRPTSYQKPRKSGNTRHG